jgi:hypothetical protein
LTPIIPDTRHPLPKRYTQKGTQERGAFGARLSLTGPAFDSNVEVKTGEILPPENQGGRRPGKPTPLPPEWQPSDEDWAYAAQQGLSGDDIEHETQRFRDWVAENSKASADWSATWRRFMGNSRQHKRNQRQTLAERTSERIAEMVKAAEAMEAMERAAGRPTFNPDEIVWVSKHDEPELWKRLVEINGKEFPDLGRGGRNFRRGEVEQARMGAK